MELIDAARLNADIDKKIVDAEANRDKAVENGWFEKAARYHIEIECTRQLKFMINKGDYHVRPSS